MDDGHFENWIAAVRAQDPGLLNADIAEGHMASCLCFLGNIAWRTERTPRFDHATERFIGDDEADRLLRSDYRKPFTLPETV